MGQRIFEEVAVILKKKYTIRVLEFKEMGQEYTEISIYSKEVTEKNNDDFSDYFEFCFTVKGKGDEEKEKIEKMTEEEFEEFIKHMTHYIEKKYNIYRLKEEEKKKAEAKKKEEEKIKREKALVVESVESMTDFNVEEDPSLAGN